VLNGSVLPSSFAFAFIHDFTQSLCASLPYFLRGARSNLSSTLGLSWYRSIPFSLWLMRWTSPTTQSATQRECRRHRTSTGIESWTDQSSRSVSQDCCDLNLWPIRYTSATSFTANSRYSTSTLHPSSSLCHTLGVDHQIIGISLSITSCSLLERTCSISFPPFAQTKPIPSTSGSIR